MSYSDVCEAVSLSQALARAQVELTRACVPQERGFPDINIVMEKVSFDGITRFEDRERMPLGALPLPQCAWLVTCSVSPGLQYLWALLLPDPPADVPKPH